MGHAGAVISGGSGTAEAKIAAMREAGITVCEGPHVLGKVMKERLGKGGKAPAAAVASPGPKPGARPAPVKAPVKAAAKAPAKAPAKAASSSRAARKKA